MSQDGNEPGRALRVDTHWARRDDLETLCGIRVDMCGVVDNSAICSCNKCHIARQGGAKKPESK